MYFPIWSAFYLLLTYVNRSFCFEFPQLNSDDCFSQVKEKCDDVAIAKADVPPVNSTLKYFLFTRKNQKVPNLLHQCKGTLPLNNNFNPKNKLLVFSSGFMYGFCKLPVVVSLKDEYLKKGDYNVLMVDPTDEYGFDYPLAYKKMSSIADEVSKVLKNIQDQTGIKNDLVELAGHSLGAHLSGMVSKNFRVHRITGIDPAGVHFTEKSAKELRLDPGDATLVDIFHCNGGPGIPYFGIGYPAGDADFFINGGELQPNCRDLAIQAMKGLDMLFAVAVATGPTVCSHVMCVYYYHASINNERGHMHAWECDNYKDFQEGKCSGKEPVVLGYDYEQNFTQGENQKPFPRKYYISTGKTWHFPKDTLSLKNKLTNG